MHKVMVFIDYQNFNINLKEHFKNKDKELRSINYKKLGNAINELIPFNSEVIKTFIFAYKPNDKLMSLESNKKYYEWLTEKLKKTKYLEVIEGRQEIRYYKDTKFDINNPDTYTTVEKETDINLATHMVAKGFQNAYDIAVLVSGDTDYTSVIQTLHNIGKIIVIAHFKHQNISKYDGIYDAEVILYDDILEKMNRVKIGNNYVSLPIYSNNTKTEPERPKIECPYCHSINTRKIGTTSRMVSAGMFGLASKKIGKQWHCNNCKSDF